MTDPGKTSKKGDITLVKTTEGFKTIRLEDMGEGMEDQLVTVFENGEVVKEYDFPEIRYFFIVKNRSFCCKCYK